MALRRGSSTHCAMQARAQEKHNTRRSTEWDLAHRVQASCRPSLLPDHQEDDHHGRVQRGGARDPRRRRGGRRRVDQEGVPQGRAAHAPRQEQGRSGRQGQIPARRRGVQVPDRSELRRRRGRRDRGGAVHADGGDVRGVLRAAAHDVAPLGDPSAAARARQDDDDEVCVTREGSAPRDAYTSSSYRPRRCPRARV